MLRGAAGASIGRVGVGLRLAQSLVRDDVRRGVERGLDRDLERVLDEALVPDIVSDVCQTTQRPKLLDTGFDQGQLLGKEVRIGQR